MHAWAYDAIELQKRGFKMRWMSWRAPCGCPSGPVRGGEVAPPAAAGWTVVYVLRRSDGWVYCGETDNLGGRVAAHRQAAARDAR